MAPFWCPALDAFVELTLYAGQESDELADGVIARMNPATGGVEAIDILFFASRFGATGRPITLPVTATIRTVTGAWAVPPR